MYTKFKQCPKCRELKECTEEEWYKVEGRRGDGWSGYCKECTKNAGRKNKGPLLVEILNSGPGSLMSKLSKSVRMEVHRHKGPVYVHIRETGRVREYKGNEEYTYGEWLSKLHDEGWGLKEVRVI